MVRAFFPQKSPNSLVTNTNYTPQNFLDSSGGIPPPVSGDMEYEDNVIMEYEDNVDMEYES